jgi:hypothetical protein
MHAHGALIVLAICDQMAAKAAKYAGHAIGTNDDFSAYA